MLPSDATRQIMWNISSPLLMYVLFILSLFVFGYGVYRHICFWSVGRPSKERFLQPGKRLMMLLKALISQKKTFNTSYPGIFHGLIFYSFLVLLLTTIVILMDYDFGTNIFKGKIYLLLSFAADVFGILFLIGIVMALWRRLVMKPKTLDSEKLDILWLVWLAVILLTGYVIEGLRIQSAGDPWSWISPFGGHLANFFQNMPADRTTSLHSFFWWLHTLLVMSWIAAIPYTKFFHTLLVPMNAFFAKLSPAGELSRIDIEALMEDEDLEADDFNIGVGKTADYTWKQRMDLDACLLCGRCEAICPASRAGQPFSPKTFIRNMRDLATTKASEDEDGGRQNQDSHDIIPAAFDENFVWFCRTCLACVEICPAYVEHVDTIFEIRRNEVNMKGRLPVQASQCLKTIESLGNPFGPQTERMKFTNTLDVPVIKADETCDVLYWIGCFTSLDASKQKIAADLCSVMKKTGVDFGILGEGEHCCGDPARIMGEENMFQMMAKEQVAELNQRHFQTLLVSCPHGYNVLKNEYPQFGGSYHVLHYTEFLYELVLAQKWDLKTDDRRKVAYHDPCYLGRYQKIYDTPRKLIDLVSPRRIEMPDFKGKSLCCGGGGGHFWMDFKEGDRINNLRVTQAEKAGVDCIVTACPFCLHMLDDSVKLMNLENKIEVMDIASLILNSIESQER